MKEGHDLRKKLGIYFYIFLVVSCIGYGIFRVYPLISKPKIVIHNLKDGSPVTYPTFQIIGNIKRANKIELQGKPINIDENGNFGEELVALLPYTIITIKAVSKYNKESIQTIRVFPKQ